MFGWAAMIGLLTLLGIATAFVGLAVAVPAPAYATWHACRDMIAEGRFIPTMRGCRLKRQWARPAGPRRPHGPEQSVSDASPRLILEQHREWLGSGGRAGGRRR
jgi:hypothetical protein